MLPSGYSNSLKQTKNWLTYQKRKLLTITVGFLISNLEYTENCKICSYGTRNWNNSIQAWVLSTLKKEEATWSPKQYTTGNLRLHLCEFCSTENLFLPLIKKVLSIMKPSAITLKHWYYYSHHDVMVSSRVGLHNSFWLV